MYNHDVKILQDVKTIFKHFYKQLSGFLLNKKRIKLTFNIDLASKLFVL